MQAFGFGWMVHLAATFAHYTSFVIPFVIAGVGISMALPSVSPGGLNAVPQDLLGKAAGTLNTMQQFGALFGVAVITAVFTAHGSLATSAAVTSGYPRGTGRVGLRLGARGSGWRGHSACPGRRRRSGS